MSYTLDKVGNRLSRSSGLSALGSQLGLAYNARDWLATDTYDANGNTVGAIVPNGPGSTAVVDSYDFENRLILRTRADGTQINVAYDADGLRIQKTLLDASAAITSATSYLVDTNNLTGYAQVFEERATSGSPAIETVKTYTYGSDLISVSSTRSSLLTTRYYLYDGGGTVRELADESGTITDRYDYDAFGLLIHRSGTTDNAYLYRGEQWDEDLGLYYNRARYLNPDSGRFWSMDVDEGIDRDPFSLHKYLYAGANAVTYVDPSGFAFQLPSLGALSSVIGILSRMAVRALVRVALRDVRRNLCIASATAASNAHHLVPVLFGENRAKGKTVPLPENFHREFHRLLHYMLKGAGLPGGNVDRGEYADLFKSNPASRAAAHTVLIQAAKIFDKSCAKKIGFRLTPLIKKQIQKGQWDF